MIFSHGRHMWTSIDLNSAHENPIPTLNRTPWPWKYTTCSKKSISAHLSACCGANKLFFDSIRDKIILFQPGRRDLLPQRVTCCSLSFLPSLRIQRSRKRYNMKWLHKNKNHVMIQICISKSTRAISWVQYSSFELFRHRCTPWQTTHLLGRAAM